MADQLSGGLSSARPPNDKVHEVIAKIKPVLEKKLGYVLSSLEAITYRPQTVAGTNYFVKVSNYCEARQTF